MQRDDKNWCGDRRSLGRWCAELFRIMLNHRHAESWSRPRRNDEDPAVVELDPSLGTGLIRM